MLVLSPLLLAFVLLVFGLMLYLKHLSKGDKNKLLSASNFSSKELYIDGRCFLLVPFIQVSKTKKKIITIRKIKGFYYEIDEITNIIVRKVNINSLPNNILVCFIDLNEFYQPK